MMLTIGAVLVGLVVLVAIVFWLSKRSAHGVTPPAPRVGDDRVVLDVTVDDPREPAVQRLALDAGRRALAADPEGPSSITVLDRTGRHLVELHRHETAHRVIELPEALHEPHRPHRHVPTPVGHDAADRLPELHHQVTHAAVGPRRFADRYQLDGRIRRLITDPDDPSDVVRAILIAGGRPAHVSGDLVVSGDTAVTVAAMIDDPEAALSAAVLRLSLSGAPHGIVIRLGYADPRLVRRRDAATPGVELTDANAVQRMADAVHLGVDPLRFAVGAAAGSR